MKKLTKKYYFSVEGDTEVWYLDWLRDMINSVPERKFNVSFVRKKEIDPIRFVKWLSIQDKTIIYHLSDYESNDREHQMRFTRTMDKMREAEKLGKNVKYLFGYSNFTFDLWIILHKANCLGQLSDRSQYLNKIKSVFGEEFMSMDEYKEDGNFHRCLSKLTLDDVREAVRRSEKIMSHNAETYSQVEYRKFKHYRENPALEVGTIISGILKDCGLMSWNIESGAAKLRFCYIGYKKSSGFSPQIKLVINQ